MRFVVLTGLPGVGKTAMLERLATAGEQVIDLESLAGHRGSSFGRIGLTSTEPTKLEFDAVVSSVLAACDPERPVWLEDEGPHIGRLWLPDEIVSGILTAQTVELSCPREVRVARLCATYGTVETGELIAATQKIRRRLGNSQTDRTISHFHAGRTEAAIRVLLEYFDEGYALRAAGDARRPLPAVEMPAVLREGH